MIYGLLAGLFWALETLTLNIALQSTLLISSAKALFLAPFVATFIHDSLSALFSFIYNIIRGHTKSILTSLKTKNAYYVMLGAIIGGPVGMSGYVMTIKYLGASIGAVTSAIFPAIGAVTAYFFLKERLTYKQWFFLLLTLIGVYGLSYSPNLEIDNFTYGLIGAFMCSFGWGLEAVILAKSMQDSSFKDEYALSIRQSTSAIIYGLFIMPILKGYPLVLNIMTDYSVFSIIALAALFATISYLFYYKSIASIGASKAMALDVTYTGWSVVLSIIIFKEYSLLTVSTVLFTVMVVVSSILTTKK